MSIPRCRIFVLRFSSAGFLPVALPAIGVERASPTTPSRCGKAASRPIIIALAALFLAACNRQTPPPGPAAPASAQDLVTIDPAPVRDGRIKWEAIRQESLSEALKVTGRIGVDENRTSRVGSIADGRIVAVYANVGDQVKKGQVLARLHSHEVHDARSEYVKAKSEMSRRRAELEFATSARDRASRLHQLKATSLEQLQRAETDLRSAQLAIGSAQADINRIEEHLRHLGLSTEGAEEEYTKVSGPGDFEEEELVPVTAPIAGTILKRLVSPGTVVTPTNDLLLISDLSNLWVNAEVPEKYLPALKMGRPVRITVQAYGDRIFAGRITLIGDTLNPDTRTIQVRCDTQNEARLLKPEMYATVSFELGETRQALMIASVAVHDVNGQSTIFVRESDTNFRAHIIRIGRQAGDRTEVLEGLKPGQNVVTAGSFLLKSELLKRQMAGE